MRTLIWSKTFVRAFKRTIKKHPTLEQDIEETLRLLVNDPFNPYLETHKLKGKLSGSWACSAGYDLRIIFDFVKSEQRKENDIFLIEIGKHDEVY
ncbi:MAG: type II toxin-antitoxin system mRNA interferase toxin, RelE/StbE family [bacterium]|nr:type II toxin-antitoxin system mRNA interferase toxin, RelE/StbE family [bacterium]